MSRSRNLSKFVKDIDDTADATVDAFAPDITLGGATVYNTSLDLPQVGNTAGDQAFAIDTSRLYIWNGNGWYNVALLNLAPSIISVQDSDGGTTPFELSSEGAVTTITITATDSDGDPLTYAAVTDSDFTGLATISNVGNEFTITPLSEDSATTESGTITFTASDGVNLGTSGVQTFTMQFAPDWTTITQQQQIQSSDIEATDFFGRSVAINGDTVVVGADGEDTGGSAAGAAYVFTRSGSTWTQQQKLQSSDIAAADNFAGDQESLAISGDTLVVGVSDEDIGGSGSGAAYVFTRSGSTWTQQQKLSASNAGTSDAFGYSVAIDGDTVIVGARLEDTGETDAGSAYIFTRSGSTWTEQQKIQASDAALQDYFGTSVSISGDTVIVGAGYDGGGGGSAYVFTRSGSTWTQQQKLTASDAAAADRFGESVAISGDTVVVGAYGDESNTGAAYVFTRSGSTWTQQQKLTASDATAGDLFALVVAIDGNSVIVGARAEDTSASNAGSAYIFTRSGSTWTEQQKIQASNAGQDDNFGYSVAIDGNSVIVGARTEDTSASNAGSAYIFVAE